MAFAAVMGSAANALVLALTRARIRTLSGQRSMPAPAAATPGSAIAIALARTLPGQRSMPATAADAFRSALALARTLPGLLFMPAPAVAAAAHTRALLDQRPMAAPRAIAGEELDDATSGAEQTPGIAYDEAEQEDMDDVEDTTNNGA